MLLQSWAAVAVSLILVMVNLVNGDDCFVPDTTWEAEINHGITNIATKVSSFLFLSLHCNQSVWFRKSVKQFARMRLIAKASPTSTQMRLLLPTSVWPSPTSSPMFRSPAPTVWVEPATAAPIAQVSLPTMLRKTGWNPANQKLALGHFVFLPSLLVF